MNHTSVVWLHVNNYAAVSAWHRLRRVTLTSLQSVLLNCFTAMPSMLYVTFADDILLLNRWLFVQNGATFSYVAMLHCIGRNSHFWAFCNRRKIRYLPKMVWAMVWPHTNTPTTPRSTARVYRHTSMISHQQYLDVSTTLRTGCSLTDSNLIRGRRNCCGARPVGVRTDFQPPHWQSALWPSPRCPRYTIWASS